MAAEQEKQIDQAISQALAAELFSEHAEQLRLFLIGVLRDHQLADDVLQSTFVRLAERGHQAEQSKLKSWLFKVAYNEALTIRRREKTGDKVLQHVAWSLDHPSDDLASADAKILRSETQAAVRRALDTLPAEQRRIVRMRVYEEKTFATIASELNIPLGTALGRMRSALQKLKMMLHDENS